MRSSLADLYKPFPLIRVALIAALTLLSSGWTCNAIFLSCQGVVQSQVTSLAPDRIPIDVESDLLMVDGSGFTSQSQIMWNGNALQTTFMDSRHLQTTVTQQTFDSLGGSLGDNVQISVRSPASFDELGCPIGGNSATLVLVIN